MKNKENNKVLFTFEGIKRNVRKRRCHKYDVLVMFGCLYLAWDKHLFHHNCMISKIEIVPIVLQLKAMISL